jgi:hypothetical protein
MIFLVVVTASPATTRTFGTYIIPKRPNGSISGPYSNPAILATLFGDVLAVRVVISIPPNLIDRQNYNFSLMEIPQGHDF